MVLLTSLKRSMKLIVALMLMNILLGLLFASTSVPLYAAPGSASNGNAYRTLGKTVAPITTNPYQGQFGPPDCTWYAWQRLHDVEGIDAQFQDNADQWAVDALKADAFWSEQTNTYIPAQVNTSPAPGDIMVLPVESKYAHPYHVAFVEAGLDTSGYFRVSQQSYGDKAPGQDTQPYPWTFDSRINLQDLQSVEKGQARFIHFSGKSTPPQPVDGAMSVDQSANLQVLPGQKFTVYFVKQNTGNTTWSDNGGYALACVANCMGESSAGFDGQSVQPGDQWQFNLTLTAPSTPGMYPTAWVPEHNNVQFGDATMFITVTADPSAKTLPPSSVFVRDASGMLYALNATTGTPRWQYNDNNSDETETTYSDGVLYLISSNATIVALNANSGKVRWQRQFTYGAPESLLAMDGVLYVAASTNGNSLTSFAGSLYALDIKSGNVLWHFQAGQGTLFLAPTIVGNIIYFTVSSSPEVNVSPMGEIDALNRSNGTLIWHYELPHEYGNISRPVVLNGMVFICSAWLETGSEGNVYAFNATSGELVWEKHFDDGSQALAAADGILYVGTTSDSVYALDPGNASVIWHYQFSPDLQNQLTTVPTVAGGIVYVNGYRGTLYALRADNGSPIWNVQIGGGGGELVEADGVVYTETYDSTTNVGGVSAVRVSDGTVLWQQQVTSVAMYALLLDE